MPRDVQEDMVHSLEGLENAKILEYAYAIEYDAIDPLQVKPSLESKIIENLFTAGQINGTSGYEEAAGQGIIAGINASKKIKQEEALVLKRNEAYIGVLIDDLVTKGTIEPYRMLTSRAEYRLLLRHDNADLRLRKYGYEAGLIDEERYQKLLKKEQNIEDLKNTLKSTIVTVDNEKRRLSLSIYDYLKDPHVTLKGLIEEKVLDLPYPDEILEQVEIQIKYAGYIDKNNKEVEKLVRLEKKKIPKDIDYKNVNNLASEARQKLESVRPETIAQASRISGVNPADIAVLSVYLKKEYGKNE